MRFEKGDKEFGLAANLIDRGFVSNFGHKLVCLNVDVLLSGKGLGGLDVASEEFFGPLRSLLLKPLGIEGLFARSE